MIARPRRSAVLLAAGLAITSGCGHQSPSVGGMYTPRTVPSEEPKIPLDLGYVAIWRIDAVTADHPQRTPLTAAEREQFARDFLPALTADLYASGRFRPPKPGEEPYKLDLWFRGFEFHVEPGYTVMTVLGSMLLGVPFLLGVPTQLLRMGSGVIYQMTAPDGTLVLQSYTWGHHNVPRGVYYAGRARQPIGAAAADVIAHIKEISSKHWDDIIHRREYAFQENARFYEPLFNPGMLQGMLTPEPYVSRDKAAHRDPTRPLEDPWEVPIAANTAPPAATVPPPMPSPPPEFLRAAPQPGTFVLSVGIDRYRDAPRAIGAEDDARRIDRLFADTFSVPAIHRRLLLGDRATRSDIDQGLRWLADKVRTGGRVVVYFSGHGAPDATTGTPYLVPYEVDPAAVAASSLRLEDVERRLADLKVRDVVLIIDACFSGTGPRSIAPAGARPLVFVEPTARVIRLAAAAFKESAGTTTGNDGGLFTHYLLQALGDGKADGDGDGQITFTELGAWVTPRVVAAARTLGRSQTPSFQLGGKHGSDEIVLGWGYPIE